MVNEVSELRNIIIAVFGVLLLIRAVEVAVSNHQADSQKQILNGIGVFNGLALELGLSPMQSVAGELTVLTPLLPYSFPALIGTIVSVGTIISLLWGLSRMWEGAGKLGAAAFLLTFVAGTLLPYQRTAPIGLFLVVYAGLMAKAASTNPWRTGGL